jgi:predicted nicotinamide N-methyase
VLEEFVPQSIELPSGELHPLQPRESAELPDKGGVEWAPIAPYWSVLWRSGVALARELDGLPLRGRRVVELGCGLAVPSIVAARAGAAVLATDSCAEALTVVKRNADENGVRVGTAAVDWKEPEQLVARAPFDLMLAADVLYERASIAPVLALLPRLGPEAGSRIPAGSPTPLSSRRHVNAGQSRRVSAASCESTDCGWAESLGRPRRGSATLHTRALSRLSLRSRMQARSSPKRDARVGRKAQRRAPVSGRSA